MSEYLLAGHMLGCVGLAVWDPAVSVKMEEARRGQNRGQLRERRSMPFIWMRNVTPIITTLRITLSRDSPALNLILSVRIHTGSTVDTGQVLRAAACRSRQDAFGACCTLSDSNGCTECDTARSITCQQ